MLSGAFGIASPRREAGHAAESQCSTDVTRRVVLGNGSIRVTGVFLLAASCGTATYYAPRPQEDRSSYLAAHRLTPGMTLDDVVAVMIDTRLGNQHVVLESGAKCPAVSTRLVLHAGETLANVAGTRISAGGFASIEIHRRSEGSLSTFGFERQGPFREAVRVRQEELLVCDEAVLSFDSTVEGHCGRDTLRLEFDSDGIVRSVGAVASEACAP
jgi:hypothetical protein